MNDDLQLRDSITPCLDFYSKWESRVLPNNKLAAKQRFSLQEPLHPLDDFGNGFSEVSELQIILG
jgi:hypothetical protein